MSTIIQNNLPLLHRKEWQMMTPSPVTNAAGMFIVADEFRNLSLLVTSATSHYLYHHDEDGFVLIPSGALAGIFGVGACGCYQPWSITYTANGGSTSTVKVAAGTHNLNGFCRGARIEFLTAGANYGIRATVTEIKTDGGTGDITLTLNTILPTAVLSTHTFRLSTGRFYVMNAGTIAAGIFKVFDVGTMAWQSSLSTTNLPATWATDGKIVNAFNANLSIDYGLATSGTANTIADTGKSWDTNTYTNYLVCIIGGTGIGQTRLITSNTATELTVDTAWSVNPDATSYYEIVNDRSFAYGKATSATGTTLVNSGKSWTADQWINYQVRITGGTGIGQIRTITDNDTTSLTVATWTTTPDSTSTYIISGNEDYLYLIGNAAVTMYRYSISGNSWTVMAPTVARSAAPAVGMGFDWIGITGDVGWGDESAILDGQYIYSPRGGASANIDRFKISGGTAGAGAWSVIAPVPTETFTTGSSHFVSGRYIYMVKEATNRFFKYAIRGNYIEPVSTDFYTSGTALAGHKLWVKSLNQKGTVKWLYYWRNAGTEIRRLMLV